MTCTANFIGIKRLVDLGVTQPSTSGHYIEELEGLDLSKLAAIEPGKETSAKDLFEMVHNKAFGLVLDDIRAQIRNEVNTQNAIEQGVFGRFTETVATPIAGDCGIRIESKHGHFGRLLLTGLNVMPVGDMVDAVITITDGVQTSTVTSDLVGGGENRVEVNFQTSKKWIEITVDGESGWYTVDISDCCNFCTGRSDGGARYEYLKAKPVCGNKPRAIIPDVALVCDFEQVICYLLPTLVYPVLYKIGIELLKEWVASNRLNWLTVFGKPWAEAKIAEWEGINYPRAMMNATSGLSEYLKKADNLCTQCGGLSFKYVMP